MADDAERDVRELALRVVAALLTPSEVAEHDVGVLVDRRRVDDVPWGELEESDSADLFTVSLGYPGSSRAVPVDIDRGQHRPASLAWAAFAIADTFQDEVIELLREARPRCSGHPHPMTAVTDGLVTSWNCPNGTSLLQPLWP